MGRFITFEGIDGAGKSSHIDWYAAELRRRNRNVVVTREPGGTELAEKLRELILGESMGDLTELLLVFAARSDHLDRQIKPALARGDWVVCDRYLDSSFAYQGAGRHMSTAVIETLAGWVCGDCQPDRTYLFDLDPEQAQRRRESVRDADRFESEQVDFFESVRRAYLARADAEPTRVLRIDGGQTIETIRQVLASDLDSLDAA